MKTNTNIQTTPIIITILGGKCITLAAQRTVTAAEQEEVTRED